MHDDDLDDLIRDVRKHREEERLWSEILDEPLKGEGAPNPYGPEGRALTLARIHAEDAENGSPRRRTRGSETR